MAVLTPTVNSNALIAGFDDPVQHGQQVFRALLKAMSEPGTLIDLDLNLTTPGQLNNSTWQTLLSLLDADTRLWLSPGLSNDESITSNLRFHCQSPIIDDSKTAAFAVALADELPALTELDWGSAEYPDRSTTLIVQVPALSDEPHWALTGPGIESQKTARIAGLNDTFRQALINSRKRFPLGVDCIFCCGSKLLALPRSTQIRELRPAEGEV